MCVVSIVCMCECVCVVSIVCMCQRPQPLNISMSESLSENE